MSSPPASSPQGSPEKPGHPLSHVSNDGSQARMVDVGAKPISAREASAHALVRFPPSLLSRVLAGAGPKGPVTEVARVAGMLAAKRTSEWIPMCHLLPLDHVEIAFEANGDVLEVRCSVRCTARTGVEMEALVGASAAALTIYDMTKALDHNILIERIELLEKRGGKSGTWRRG